MMTKINWEQLALQVGSIKDEPVLGRHERGGVDVARKALELILSEDVIRDAVDYYVKGGKGTEVILSVLQLLRPVYAMNRCYQIYRAEVNIETRRSALVLLAHIADYHALAWVEEFLAHPDEDINVLSIWVLDRLLFLELQQPETFRLVLDKAEQHSSQRVRSQLAELSVRERFEDLALEADS